VKRLCTVVLAAGAVLAGCAAPADLDGEVGGPAGAALGPAPTAAPGQVATPVVVDTDLGADDLVALGFLLRHPGVHVEAVTIAATGLVGCDPGVELVAAVFEQFAVPAVPVACGRDTAVGDARSLPAAWRAAAAAGSGLTPVAGTVTPAPEPAPQLIADTARRVEDLVVVALGPMTNLADLATQHADDYARLGAVQAMGGSVAGPVVDGVAEWNAAADPESFATVLAAAAPLTIVPEDAIPLGTPDALDGPVVGRVSAVAGIPAWWDLATAGAVLAPRAGRVEVGEWVLDPSAPGRLRKVGVGDVRVYRSLDPAPLEAQYARAFATA